MPCEVNRDPALFNGAPTFLCSHTQPGEDEPQACATCGSSAVYLCDWAVERFEVGRIEEVRHGDIVRRFYDKDGERPGRATVASIDPMPPHYDEDLRRSHLLITLSIAYKNGASRRKTFEASLRSRIRILRPATCDAPACEAHVREVADEVHYCAAHWGAWEAR